MKYLDYKNIKLLILDVDGVLTDGKLIYSVNGEELKYFDVKDGLGIKIVHQYIEIAIISGNPSNIIFKRSKDLGIEYCFLGVENKNEKIVELSHKLNLLKDNIVYIGDDLNDLSVMDSVGIFICPSDAHKTILKEAHKILNSKGGHGAVREFVDEYLESLGLLDNYKKGINKKNL